MKKCKECQIGEWKDWYHMRPALEGDIPIKFNTNSGDIRFDVCPHCNHKIDWDAIERENDEYLNNPEAYLKKLMMMEKE